MSIVENTFLYVSKNIFRKIFHVNNIKEIPLKGVVERKNIPYNNYTGQCLKMDIYEPKAEVRQSQDIKANIHERHKRPVVICIHGGGLIDGSKEHTIGFCRQLSRRGLMVFSLEYRLLPNVRVYEQFKDVCAGMDFVNRYLKKHCIDSNGCYVVAESAGAYLAIYTAAICKSKTLQKATGCKPSTMPIRGMALISGMFYTARKDAVGILLSKSIYEDYKCRKRMRKFMNPEHPELINNLPPIYMVTSKADIIEQYTLYYYNALRKKNKKCFLRHMGRNPKLTHAFPVLKPELPQSEKVIDEIVKWFEKLEK